LKKEDVEKWKVVLDEEYKLLMKNNTWELIELP
jgi:hypothetical protein